MEVPVLPNFDGTTAGGNLSLNFIKNIGPIHTQNNSDFPPKTKVSDKCLEQTTQSFVKRITKFGFSYNDIKTKGVLVF